MLINKGQYRLKPNEIKYGVDEKPSAIPSFFLALQVMTLFLSFLKADQQYLILELTIFAPYRRSGEMIFA